MGDKKLVARLTVLLIANTHAQMPSVGVPHGSVAVGYAVSGNSSSSTVVELGHVRCADGWARASPFVAPTVEAVIRNSTAEPNASSTFAFRGCVPEACARVACIQPAADSCVAATVCTPTSAPFCVGPATRPNGTSCYDGPLHGQCQSDGTCVTRVHIVSQLTLELDTQVAALSIDAVFNTVGNVLSTVLTRSGIRCVPEDVNVVEWRISYGNLVLDYSASVHPAEAMPAALATAATAVNDPALDFSWNDTNLGGIVKVLSAQGTEFRTVAWHRNVSVCQTGCGIRDSPERIYDTYFCTEDGRPQGVETGATAPGAEESSSVVSCLTVVGAPPEATSQLCAASKPCCEAVGPMVSLQSPDRLVMRTGSAVQLRATISSSHCDYRDYRHSVVDSGNQVWSAAVQTSRPRTRITWRANRTDGGGVGRSTLYASTADNRTDSWLNGVSAQMKDQAWLDIPPFALAPGSEITIELVSWLEWLEPEGAGGTARVQRSDSSAAVVVISVEHSPEVFARIAGGSLRRVMTTTSPLRQQHLVLDGRLSSDPDVPEATAVVWDQVEWACKNMSGGGRPCWDGNTSTSFEDNDNEVESSSLSNSTAATSLSRSNAGASVNSRSMSGNNSTVRPISSLLWDASPYLFSAATLEVSLTVTRTGRRDIATFVIEIVDRPAVLCNVSVAVADVRPKHSAGGKVVLTGSAQTSSEVATSAPAGNALFHWSATHLLPNDAEYQSIDLAAISSTRTSDAVLVVHGGSLQSGAIYRFVLHAWAGDGTCEGLTGVDIKVNKFDQTGTILAYPGDGLAVSDIFSLEASGFIDADLPLYYRFSQSAIGAAEVDGARKTQLLTKSSLSNRAEVVLSQGDSAHNYLTLVHVRVADAYGDTAEAQTMVRVRPLFTTTGAMSSAAAERLEQVDGDVVQTMQVVAAFAGLNGSTYRVTEDLVDAIQTRDVLGNALLKVATRIAADGKNENDDSFNLELAHVELLVGCLRIVTDDMAQLSGSSANATLHAIELIITTGQRHGWVFSREHVENMALATSNLLQASTVLFLNATSSTTEHFGMTVMRIVTRLGQALITDTVVVGEDPVAIDLPSFFMSAQKNRPKSFAGAALPLPPELRAGHGSQLSIFVPNDVFEGVFDTLRLNHGVATVDHVIAHVVAWKLNPYFFVSSTTVTEATSWSSGRAVYHSNGSSQELGSDVLGLTFRYGQSQGGNEIELRGMTTPFVITLRGHNISGSTTADRLVPYCAYFGDRAWVIDNDAGIGQRDNNTGAITCNYSHLTDFAAFNGARSRFEPDCTFGCWTRTWTNNIATFPLLGLAVVLLLTWCGATNMYCQQRAKLCNSDFLQTDFAYQRRRVLASDQKEPATEWEGLKHRLRHEYTFGGLLFALQGDPYDRWQRACLISTSVIVNICVSLFVPGRGFSNPLDGPQCNETMNIGLACDRGAEPVMSGTAHVVATTLISAVVVYPLSSAFVWLRNPIVRAVEPTASIHKLGMWGVVVALGKAYCHHWTRIPRCCRGDDSTNERVAQELDATIPPDEGHEAGKGVLEGLKYSQAAKVNSVANAKLRTLARATGHHWILPREPPQLAPKMSAAWSEEASLKRFGLTVTVVAARIHGFSDKLQPKPYARVTVIEQDRDDARMLPRKTTAQNAALPLPQHNTDDMAPVRDREIQQLEQVVSMPSSVNIPQRNNGDGKHGQLAGAASVDNKRPPSPRRMADALDKAGLLRTRGHKYAASARRTLSASIALQTQVLEEQLASGIAVANAGNQDTMTAKDTVFEARWGISKDKSTSQGKAANGAGKSIEPGTVIHRRTVRLTRCCHRIECCCQRSGFGDDIVSKYEQHDPSADTDTVTAKSTGETLYWDLQMKGLPRLRIRIWDETSGGFLGECELQLPLSPKQFPGTGSEIQKLGTDWRWPCESSWATRRIDDDDSELQQHTRLETTRTGQKVGHWFELRASKETGMPDTLSEPLQPPVPKELEALVALMHESNDLMTASVQEHRVAAAAQLVRQAEGTLDKVLVKQAKRVQEMHRRAKHPSIAAATFRHQNVQKNDCFRGSDAVDWLVFLLLTNRALRESVRQQRQQGVVPADDKDAIHIQLPSSIKERHKAIAVGRLLLQHGVISALDTGPYANQFVDSDHLLYMLCPRREYKVRGEVALRVGWAQENTLRADTLRQELLQLAREEGVAALREHVLQQGVSRSRVSNVIVELTQVRGLVDQTEIRREETYALVELLVAHRYGSSTEEPVWPPFAWCKATIGSTVKPRPRMAMLGVVVVGAGTSALAMLIVVIYAPNLSPGSLRMCLQVAVASLVLKVLALEPALILLEAWFLWLVKGNVLARGAIEARIYDMEQR